MDKLTRYREVIKDCLAETAALFRRSQNKNVETILVLDEEQDCYVLADLGWTQTGRVAATPVFLRLRDGKIWVEVDMLEEGITKDLLAAGVPKEDIVLAFHHPEMRPLTDFAVA